jgi:hypothetical protein
MQKKSFLEALTIDLRQGGHTSYSADMSTRRKCGQQFCAPA